MTGTSSISTTHDGVEQYRRHWRADAPRAAMLLVHGIGEHSGRYEHVGSTFAEAGIDVLAFDNRGFGRTGGRRADVASFDHFLDDVEHALAERRSLGAPVVLMGHSLGGLIVARYLTDGRPPPDLAVLSAPALDAETPAWQRALAPALGAVLPRLRIGSDFDGAVLTRDEEAQRAYEQDPLRVPFTTARLGREVLRAMEATRITLDRLRIPTLVVHGADDPLVPPAASAPLEVLPNVDRIVWPGLRHEPHNEPEQDEVLAAVVAWIDTHL